MPRALDPPDRRAEVLFFSSDPAVWYRVSAGNDGLLAVRRLSSGQLLYTHVTVALLVDLDFESPERIGEELWWRSVWPTADRAVLERSMRAARRRRE